MFTGGLAFGGAIDMAFSHSMQQSFNYSIPAAMEEEVLEYDITLDFDTLLYDDEILDGAAALAVNWDLSFPSFTGGWIVQEVRLSANVVAPTGAPILQVPNTTYWEAWEVLPFSTRPTTRGFTLADDTLGVSNPAPGEYGYASWTTSAAYYDGLQLPSTFAPGNVPFAGSLPSTYENPHLSTTNATEPVIRSFDVHWTP